MGVFHTSYEDYDQSAPKGLTGCCSETWSDMLEIVILFSDSEIRIK